MKKSEWVYVASAMWTYAEKHDGKISALLKELIVKINKNMEMIIDDMGEHEPASRSHRPYDYNSTGNSDFKGLGEF